MNRLPCGCPLDSGCFGYHEPVHHAVMNADVKVVKNLSVESAGQRLEIGDCRTRAACSVCGSSIEISCTWRNNAITNLSQQEYDDLVRDAMRWRNDNTVPAVLAAQREARVWKDQAASYLNDADAWKKHSRELTELLKELADALNAIASLEESAQGDPDFESICVTATTIAREALARLQASVAEKAKRA